MFKFKLVNSQKCLDKMKINGFSCSQKLGDSAGGKMQILYALINVKCECTTMVQKIQRLIVEMRKFDTDINIMVEYMTSSLSNRCKP